MLIQSVSFLAFSTLSSRVLASFPKLVKKYFIVSINFTCDPIFARLTFLSPPLLPMFIFFVLQIDSLIPLIRKNHTELKKL